MASLYNMLLVLFIAALASAWTNINTEDIIAEKLKKAVTSIAECIEEEETGNPCPEICVLQKLKILNEQKLVTQGSINSWLALDRDDITAAQKDQRAKKCANLVKEELKNCELATQVLRCILDDF